MQLKFDMMEIQMCSSIWSIISSRNSALAEKEFVLLLMKLFLEV